MDYTFLENIPSSLTQLPSYEPDFSFLSTMQGKANQQYEAGLSEVKSDYGAIFNQPVTGMAMQQRQQEYAKQAQQKMKDVSASDLSDPKNQQIAKNILAPFHEDTLLVKNIGLTSWYDGQKSKINSMRNSKDKDQRELYNNPILENGINNAIEQLADAPLTQDAYNNLEQRAAIPIVNVQDAADKAYAALYGKDGGIKTTDADGMSMSISTGGPKSVPGYRAFISEFQQRPEYAAQNRFIATTLMENEFRDLKRNNPNVPEGEIKNLYAKRTIGQVTQYYANGIVDNRKAALEMRMKNSDILKLDANGNPIGGKIVVPDQATATQVLANINQANAYDKIASDLEQQFSSGYGFKSLEGTSSITDPNKLLTQVDTNSTEYQKTYNDIVGNPQDYVQKTYLSQQADKWANARASISSTEIKENPVWKAANDQANKDWEHKLQWNIAIGRQGVAEGKLSVEQAAEMRKEGYIIPPDMIMEASPFGGSSSGFSASSGFGTTGVHANIGSGEVGQTGTDIQKVATLDIFQRDQQAKLNSANAVGLTYNGNLQLLSEDNLPGGMADTDIVNLSSQFQQALSTGKYPSDNQSVTIRRNFMKLLHSQGLLDDPDANINMGPNESRNLMMKLAANQGATLMQSADPAKRKLGLSIMEQQQSVENNLATYNRDQTAYDNRVKSFIENDRTGVYKKLINPETHDFYKPIEMAKDFPALTIKVNGTEQQLSPIQAATMYSEGKFEIERLDGDNPIIKLEDGSKGFVTGVGNIKNGDSPTWLPETDPRVGEAFRMAFKGTGSTANIGNLPHDSILGKYGNSSQIAAIKDKIGSEIVAKLPGYATGLSGSSITYNIASEIGNKDPRLLSQKETGIGLLQEALRNPINIDDIYTTDGTNKKDQSLGEDLKKALLTHTDREAITDIFGQAQVFPHGPNGKPAIKVTTRLDKSGDKDRSTIDDQKIGDIKKIGTVWIDIADNAKGELLSQLPNPTNVYKYGHLYTDPTPIVQSEFEENSGFRYQIIPDRTHLDGSGRATQAVVVTQKWDIDPQTGMVKKDKDGKPIWAPKSKLPLPLDKFNPDMIVEYKNNWILGEMQNNDLIRSSHQVSSLDNGIDITSYFKH